MHDGYIVRGHRHDDCFKTIAGIPRYRADKEGGLWGRRQGFVTSHNRFVNRVEGCRLQRAAGIESILPGAQGYLHGELYSEDLY